MVLFPAALALCKQFQPRLDQVSSSVASWAACLACSFRLGLSCNMDTTRCGSRQAGRCRERVMEQEGGQAPTRRSHQPRSPALSKSSDALACARMSAPAFLVASLSALTAAIWVAADAARLAWPRGAVAGGWCGHRGVASRYRQAATSTGLLLVNKHQGWLTVGGRRGLERHVSPKAPSAGQAAAAAAPAGWALLCQWVRLLSPNYLPGPRQRQGPGCAAAGRSCCCRRCATATNRGCVRALDEEG